MTSTVDRDLKLLPAKRGTCPMCETKHQPEEPHNQQSLFYGIRFEVAHGRSPTWEDALAHCSAEIKETWKQQLLARGAWSDSDYEPIAEPGGVMTPEEGWEEKNK